MSNFTIEGTVSVNVQEVYHPIISNAFIQFHNIPTDMSPLENDDRFGILEIILHKTKDVYHETHHYRLPAIEGLEINIKNAMIYDMGHNKWTTSIYGEYLFPNEKHVFQIRTPKNSTEMVEAVIYGKVIGRKDEELEEGEIEEELVDCVQELYTVYELPDLIDTTDNTVDPVDLTAYMYLQTALEMTCKLTEYKDGIQQYNLNDSDIKDIKKFMKKMYKYMISDEYYNDEELFDMYDSMEECLESYLEDIKNGKNL